MLSRVEVEAAVDEDDDGFLRIAPVLKLPDDDVDDDLEQTLASIEQAMAAQDSRYARVRFVDAA